MVSNELQTLEAHVNSLDPQTARRVARLVLECRASLRDALLAVHYADQLAMQHASPRQQPGAFRHALRTLAVMTFR